MKKKYFIPILLTTILIIFSSVVITSCEKEEDLETDQLAGGKITLKSFGPSPAMRGGELRFIGTNLDKVTSVQIPGVDPITDITKVSRLEIRVIIPQTAEPGIVKLTTPEGEISTLTAIGYLEPISIDSIAPTTIKSGQTLRINGEYLNIVEEVIFADGVHVLKADFVSQSRKRIEVIIPEKAQSGKIIVSDGADILSDGEEIPNWIYSNNDLNVVLPSITSITPNPVKAGTALSITGADLDLVHSVIFAGGDSVRTFATHTGTEISLTVPMTAQDGKITLIPASEVHVESSEDLVMVNPTVSVSPTEVKNGDTITVTGTNLDLITNVTLGGGVEGTIVDGATATVMEVVVPDLAVTGEVSFTTTSSKTVSGGTLTLSSATITNFTPNSEKPGNDVVFTGTNLDVVSEVWFTGDVMGTIVSQSETSLTVTIPVGAKNGIITFIAINQEEVTTATEIEILVNLPTFTKYLEMKGAPGEILTLIGINMDLVKEIVFPGDITATAYGMKNDTMVEVYVPLDVTLGIGTPGVITYEGDEGLFPEVYFGTTDPITVETIMISNFDGDGASQSTWGSVVTFGTPSVNLNSTAAMLGLTGNGWQWTWAHNWDTRPALANPGDYVLKIDICITSPAPGVTAGMTLKGWDTAVDLGEPFANSTNGNWITMTFDILNSGMSIDGTGDWGIWINGSDYDLTGVMIDNLRFDPK